MVGKKEIKFQTVSYSRQFKVAQTDNSISLKESGLQFIRDFYRNDSFPSSSSEASLFFRLIFIIIFTEGTEKPFRTNVRRHSKKTAAAVLLLKINVTNISLLIPFLQHIEQLDGLNLFSRTAWTLHLKSIMTTILAEVKQICWSISGGNE